MNADNMSTRVKVTRACDHCKKRKIKCDGANPCCQCVKLHKVCEFKAEYGRGRDPIPRMSTSTSPFDPAFSTPTINTITTSTSPQSATPPFEGPGASIYARTQDHLNLNVDAPLPSSPSIFLLPPIQTGREMVAVYFENCSTMTFLHRPTIDRWLEEMYTDFYLIREGEASRTKNAVLFMVFAISHNLMNGSGRGEDLEPSVRFFQAAESQLKTGSREMRLGEVQARLLQSLYLLSRSRIHHCWVVFGIVINMIFALRLHRKDGEGNGEREGTGRNLIESECGKRAFWSAYTIDKYLSSALGRPQAIRDEEIDQEVPLIVDDHYLTSSSILADSSDTTAMQAFNLQIQLSQIMSRALSTLYTIKPTTSSARLAAAANLTTSLNSWRLTATPLLSIAFNPYSPSATKVRKTIITLQLIYEQTRILVCRPFLLNASEQLDGNGIAPNEKEEMESYVKRCLTAAMEIVRVVRGIFDHDKRFGANWFAHYIGYSATVVLYVYVYQNHGILPDSSWRQFLTAAETCKEQLCYVMWEDSFVHKCSVVLKELHEEVKHRVSVRDTEDVTGESGGEGSEGWTAMSIDGVFWNERATSVIERIDRYGFSSLTGY